MLSMEFVSPCGKEEFKSSLAIGHDNNIGKFLHIQESFEQTSSDSDDVNDIEEGIEDLKLNESTPSKKGLHKSSTFPCTGKVSSVAPDEVGDEVVETALQKILSEEHVHSPQRSVSLPTPSKLVSALKGTRERLGEPPRKLSVKWAADVYDPLPTIVSHTVNRSKKQQKVKRDGRNSKQKNGKKWQKGNSSRGSSSSSKTKQFRKNAGFTDKGYNTLDPRKGVVELSDDLRDFDVGGPDSYCGSSFLKESLTKVHYSVAEAL